MRNAENFCENFLIFSIIAVLNAISQLTSACRYLAIIAVSVSPQMTVSNAIVESTIWVIAVRPWAPASVILVNEANACNFHKTTIRVAVQKAMKGKNARYGSTLSVNNSETT
ncbi:unnamed protein product [Cylicostephanus goldi]|uniref:Uncharacterized protein n=1 Tax=Cylicostephanus goldi TaxID=71465 RepID=A0A3P6QXG7_CYLGO|nr:unnamed protein product [Cylicostephanus goldi]